MITLCASHMLPRALLLTTHAKKAATARTELADLPRRGEIWRVLHWQLNAPTLIWWLSDTNNSLNGNKLEDKHFFPLMLSFMNGRLLLLVTNDIPSNWVKVSEYKKVFLHILKDWLLFLFFIFSNKMRRGRIELYPVCSFS